MEDEIEKKVVEKTERVDILEKKETMVEGEKDRTINAKRKRRM